MLLEVLKKTLNIRPINHVQLALVAVQQKVQNLLNVAIALEEGKLEPTRVFLQFNKHVLSVVVMVKQLVNLAIPVVVTEKCKLMKM